MKAVMYISMQGPCMDHAGPPWGPGTRLGSPLGIPNFASTQIPVLLNLDNHGVLEFFPCPMVGRSSTSIQTKQGYVGVRNRQWQGGVGGGAECHGLTFMGL